MITIAALVVTMREQQIGTTSARTLDTTCTPIAVVLTVDLWGPYIAG
jgi:hypothetical protein